MTVSLVFTAQKILVRLRSIKNEKRNKSFEKD